MEQVSNDMADSNNVNVRSIFPSNRSQNWFRGLSWREGAILIVCYTRSCLWADDFKRKTTLQKVF